MTTTWNHGHEADRMSPCAACRALVPPDHGGPIHTVPDKKQLAIHLGVWHQSPDGSLQRVNSPSAAYLSRWRRDELERRHRELHGEKD